MTIAGGQIPRAQILRASDPVRAPPPPQAGGVQVLPTNQSVKVSGMCKRGERERERERERGRERGREREREREGIVFSHILFIHWEGSIHGYQDDV